MQPLIEFQESLLRPVSNKFRRYLQSKIRWGERMIGIKGPRGAGKTTILLQHLKFDLVNRDLALYVTADHHWFYSHSLYETASDWHKSGGTLLMIDEVHKYPGWSTELKNIYDGFPEMQIVFSASSALDIFKGEADLSRRVISYLLPGMSFREYIELQEGVAIEPISFDRLTSQHLEMSRLIVDRLHPLPLFRRYLQIGYLPFILEGEDSYPLKLDQIINTVLDTDLAYTVGYDSGTAFRLKKLLGVVAEAVPFKPNISALARKLDLSRDSVYLYLALLQKARLINMLHTEQKGTASLQKPEKLFLENSNLAFALSPMPNVGNVRETFLLNQLINAGLAVTAPGSGDFQVGNLVLEAGGKNKSSDQIKHFENHLVAADNIEHGSPGKAPLWLFGFLY
jgi:predicted AAA+ superfamily ATPase